MSTLAAIVFAFAGIHVGSHQILKIGYAPAWSPNGERIAFVTRGDLWVADADGTHSALLVKDADTPTWAPTGRALAFERDGHVWTVRADGLHEHRLAPGFHPAWSPTGRRIALDRGGEIVTLRARGGDVRALADGEEPAYSTDGRMAYVRDGAIFIAPRRVVDGGDQPTFSLSLPVSTTSCTASTSRWRSRSSATRTMPPRSASGWRGAGASPR